MKTDIQSIRSLQEIEFEGLPQKSLVIFDIDETLITPTDALLKPIGGSFKGWQTIQPEQVEYYLSIMLASTTYALVDATIPVLLAALHRQGVATMGLTACSTGCVGVIPSMTLWRCDQLRKLGINFSSCFTEEYIFPELVEATAHLPLFKNGILFTGDLQHPEKSSKGLLLGAFFDRISWKPEQIVFIDDHLKHLEAVQQMLDQRNIPFRGYRMDSPSAVLHEKIAELQIQTLLDSDCWISDQEATHLLQNMQKTENQGFRFHFKPVDKAHRFLVHHWLEQPHVAKWFYGQGLQNTINHLDDFLNGAPSGQYWLGYDQNRPFAFLITSSVEKPNDALTKWCSKEGKAITLDLLIGENDYLGKGLSHIVIQEFLLSQFPDVTEVLIDPEATNSHAIHIYKKIGFKILSEFIPSHSPHPHYMMRLDVNNSRLKAEAFS